VIDGVRLHRIGKKPPGVYRRRAHVKKALAEAKAAAAAKEGEKT
jgi:hypothetical protein